MSAPRKAGDRLFTHFLGGLIVASGLNALLDPWFTQRENLWLALVAMLIPLVVVFAVREVYRRLPERPTQPVLPGPLDLRMYAEVEINGRIYVVTEMMHTRNVSTFSAMDRDEFMRRYTL